MQEQEPLKKKNPKNLQNKGTGDFTRYTGLAFQMIGIILITVWGGIKLDKLTGWKTPVFTIVLSLLGVFAAIYTAIKDFIKWSASLKLIYKYILFLILLNVLILFSSYLFVIKVSTIVCFRDIAILSFSFSIISFITILIFLKGRTKEPASQTLYSLVAVSLKFLLEIVFALLWFIVAKKTSMQSVLIFFILYLTLTLFTLWVIVKTLKNKVL